MGAYPYPPVTPGWTTNNFTLVGDQKDVDDLRVRYRAGALNVPYAINFIDAFYCDIIYTQGISLMSPRPNENYTEYVMLDISPDTLTQVEYNLNSGGWQSISGDTALYIPEGEDHSIQVRGYYDTTQYYSDIVEFNTWNVTNSNEQGLDWGTDLINAERYWDFTTGENIKVLVIDTGMDLDHDDLADNYEKGKDWTPFNPDLIPEDENGHGTMTAGLVGAINNNIGVIGTSPKVSLYIGRTGIQSSHTEDNIADAIEWGIEEEVDVISMSLGSEDKLPLVEYRLEQAYNAGIIIVVASGNWNTHTLLSKDINYPAAYYDYTIPVGALYFDLTLAGTTSNNRWDSDPTDDYYGGSCYGYDENQGVVAAGTRITSTYLDNGYRIANGTSLACPLVAGVCALILAASSSIYQMTGSDRTDAVRECIYNSVIDLGTSGWDQYYGNGMVDATRAINYALAQDWS
jgi:subtilisin